MKTKQRKPLFERFHHGLNEGIVHAKGSIILRTVGVPEELRKLTERRRQRCRNVRHNLHSTMK